MRKLTVALLVLVALLVIAAQFRHRLLFGLQDGAPPPLMAPTDEGPGVNWVDDYYTVEEIAPDTFAIGEPRYQQQNFNYLIIGNDEACATPRR